MRLHALWLALFLAGCGGASGPDPGTPAGGVAPPAGTAPVRMPPPPPSLAARVLPAGASAAVAPAPASAGEIPLAPGWNLVSFGCARLASVSAGAGVNPSLFAYDAERGSYSAVDLEAAALEEAGLDRGFWVFAAQESSLTFEGSGSVSEITLVPGWNLVGFPVTPIRVGDVDATRTGGEPAPLPDAVCAGLPPGPGCLAAAHAFAYGGGAYQAFDLAEATTRTAPGRGVWVFAHEESRLEFLPGPDPVPPGSGPPAPPPEAAPPEGPGTPQPGPPSPPDLPGPTG